LSSQELSNLVAPVALYPDLLLSEVLAASTYPAEITQAQQWLQRYPGLRGQQLVEAARQQNWDPSVQALVVFPDVVNMLARDIQWTTGLGNAFLSQQADVMDAIQQLRASARDNGRLTNTPQQRVTYEQQNGQNAIVIQPADPQVVYPPVYNPMYVWGPPMYGAYPPVGYPPDGYGITYAAGTFIGALFSGLLSFGGWGWGLSWLSHGLFLNSLFFSHFGFFGYGGNSFQGGYGGPARVAWVHNPSHRLGVPYGNRWSGFSSQNYRANDFGRSYNPGRSAYAGSSYQGSSRQMDAWRGLAASASRTPRPPGERRLTVPRCRRQAATAVVTRAHLTITPRRALPAEGSHRPITLPPNRPATSAVADTPALAATPRAADTRTAVLTRGSFSL
jgi:hypothetical protein